MCHALTFLTSDRFFCFFSMQHWHVYRKWNERFFKECYTAYREGRSDTDPSIGWYKGECMIYSSGIAFSQISSYLILIFFFAPQPTTVGEIGFFDFYIIPLAKKLENCGVFGVSSHEYLNYALANREEWERRGQEIVAAYVQDYESRNEYSA